MTWAIQIIFKLPAWLFLILAGALLYFGTQIINLLEVDNQKLEVAAQAEPPAMVDFDANARIEEGEVALRLNVFEGAAYSFYYEYEDSEDYVEYFLFAEEPTAKETDREFSAVLVFESGNAEQVKNWWESTLVNPGSNEDLIAIRGYAARSDRLSVEASDALYYVGGTATENFVFIRPFVEGREAFYQSEILDIQLARYALWLAVAVLLAWAAIRQVVGKRLKKAPQQVPNRAKAALGVASAAAGLSGLGGDDDEEDDEDGDYGIALSIAKLLFGFLWKKRKAQKSEPSAEPASPEMEPPAPAQEVYRQAEAPQAFYSPHKQLYSENGLPIDDLSELDDGPEVEERLFADDVDTDAADRQAVRAYA